MDYLSFSIDLAVLSKISFLKTLLIFYFIQKTIISTLCHDNNVNLIDEAKKNRSLSSGNISR